MDDSLYGKLNKRLTSFLPMHMPGHKRNTELAPYLSGLRGDIDVTEISGFDNLHDPHGILKEGMTLAAELWGAYRTFYLVNGSTGGILAGIRALSRWGDKVIVQRSCHLSVYHGVELCGLNPVYLYQELLPDCGIGESLQVESLRESLNDHPDACLLILSSPGYEGVQSNLDSLVSLAHERGVRVLVDASHGAHLGLSGSFPAGAISCGAEIVIHSLHKTLSGLTQTALAHAANKWSADALAEQLDVFLTSSPSYLLMASIDGCIRLIKENGNSLLLGWREALDFFYSQMKKLNYLKIFCLGDKPPGVWAHDPSKIVIMTIRSSINGFQLAQKLRDDFGIETEMENAYSVLAMTGLGDTTESLDKLARALLWIDSEIHVGYPLVFESLPCVQAVLPPHAALSLPYVLTSLDASAELICAEYIILYPPGIPLLVPGEKINSVILQRIRMGAAPLCSRSRHDPSVLATLSTPD